MTRKQKAYRLKLLKKIHAHPVHKQIKRDGGWQEWLAERFNVESSKFLSIDALLDVLALLDGVCPAFFTPVDALGPSQNQIQAVLDLKESLRWNLARLEGFALHTCKKPLKDLSKSDTTKLILGLNKVLRAQQARLDKMYHPLNNPHYAPCQEPF
ncbi:hypothetical protein [Helicobacter felis]|uniref:Uncharacterized protein n=1 Tax=Helicobacter felis (strain ATCC 49179 / CCUG 28539 / NCTC 12436 / CS1) TaxID=936155 RepID=E7AC41_HELFC|nr:hypothetical protein [Helicobacter felis]CBY82123.1 putative uncharacterized protein [Helicobacter felis ATCC 49179]